MGCGSVRKISCRPADATINHNDNDNDDDNCTLRMSRLREVERAMRNQDAWMM